MQDLKVTIIQTDLFWEDKKKNLAQFSEKITSIKTSPDLIVLPEMLNTAFSMKPEIFAEKQDGETICWLKEKAKETGCAIVGSLMINENGNYFNRMIWMNPDGSFDYYDKRHLFRMGNEQEHFSTGNENRIINFNGWKFKLMVCYDLRFPVWAKNNYKEGKYDFDCLIYIANWPAARTNHWKCLLQARAIENQAYVIGVNRVGEDGRGTKHCGDSLIFDPQGNTLLKFEQNSVSIGSSILKFSELENLRNKFTVGLDWDNFKIYE